MALGKKVYGYHAGYGGQLFTVALLYTLSRVGLSSIVLNQEQLTGLGKSVCYQVLPFLFNFAGSKSGSFVLRWTELLLGLHIYCGKPSPSSIGTNSSRLRRPGRSSFSHVRLNNENDRFGDTFDEQILHVQSLTKAALVAVHRTLCNPPSTRHFGTEVGRHGTVASRPFFSSPAIKAKGLGTRL